LFSAQVTEVSRREPVQSAASIPTLLSDIITPADPSDKVEDVRAPNKPANPGAFREAATPDAAPAGKTESALAIANVLTARDFGVDDAGYYRQRGLLEYRSGDLYLALVDFDLAIDLDPSLSDAYVVDRGIVLYRMGDLKRAFADIAQASRMDASRPNKMPPTASAP
jgi:tetratricopeptide (TPR) repeat protein